MARKTKYGSVQLWKHRQKQLRAVSLATQKEQFEIIDEFVKRLYEAILPHSKSVFLENKNKSKRVIFDYEVKATVLDEKDFCSGSRVVPMTEDDSITQEKTKRECEERLGVKKK